MNIASYIHSMVNNWSKAIVRFPLFIIGCLLTCTYFSYIQYKNIPHKDHIVMPLFIGLGGILLASIINESFKIAAIKKAIAYTLAIATALVYYFLLPHTESYSVVWPELTFTSLILVFHLSYAIAPFVKNSNEDAFLRYNVHVLEIFVESALLCTILFALLNLALYALKTLFGLSHDYTSIAHLFIWITGFVHSVNFLSAFPALPVQVDTLHRYTTRFYKTLVLYISIPVMIIYGLIVMAYIVKLAIGGSYQPWITSMCGWYLGIGLLVLLFSKLYLKDNSGELAVIFNKYFAIVSLPIVLLFIYCTYTNIAEEGLNSSNYYSVLMAAVSVVLLGCLAFYKEFNLIWIPTTILLFTLLSILPGPFNAWTMPLNALKTRLTSQLHESGNIKNDVLNFDAKIDSLKSIQIEKTIYSLGYNEELQFLKAYDKNQLLPDTIKSYTLIEKLQLNKNYTASPLESKYYDYLPAIDIQQATLYPIINKYFNIINGFTGLKISNEGNVLVYENLNVTDSLIIPIQAVDRQKISLVSSVKKDSFEIYVTNLSYQVMGGKCKIEDLTGIALKK